MTTQTIATKISAQPNYNFTVNAERYNLGGSGIPGGSSTKYYPGDLALLVIKTNPYQLNQSVWRRRYYRKNPTTPYYYQESVELGSTSEQDGVFVNWAVIPDKSSLFGEYLDIYHVPNTSGPSDLLFFSICPTNEREVLLKKISEEVKEVSQEVQELL